MYPVNHIYIFHKLISQMSDDDDDGGDDDDDEGRPMSRILHTTEIWLLRHTDSGGMKDRKHGGVDTQWVWDTSFWRKKKR